MEEAEALKPASPSDEKKGIFQALHATTKASKWTFLLAVTGITATLGTSVPVGYNIGVINAPANYMKQWCNETLLENYDWQLTDVGLETLWSSVVSIFLVGGVVGSLGGAWLADRLGRRGSYLVCGVLLIVSALCFQFCRAISSVELLIIGRLIVGLASGLTFSIVPMYLTEIAPLELRGTLGVLCSMGVTGGVVVGQVFSLQQIFGTEDLWQFALSFYAILVIVCYMAYPWLPESPKYLYVTAGRQDDAVVQLKRLRGKHTNIRAEIDEMNVSANEGTQEKRSLWSVIRDPTLLLPLVIVCALQAGQQLSGINAVFYYSVSIFEKIGLSTADAKWANLGAGCLNLFIACFSPLLMARVNRRPLIIMSCLVSGAFLCVLTLFFRFIEASPWNPFACVAAIFGYIIFYQLGLGPIPYFIGAELFLVGPRPAAMSIGSIASWSGNFLVGMTFPTLSLLWGAWVFLPFTLVCFGLTLLLKVYLPETRGRDIADIVPLVSKGFQSTPLRGS